MFRSQTLKCAACRAVTKSAAAVKYSAREMRVLARNGFGEVVPLLRTQPEAQRRGTFVEFADSYETEWQLCPSCASLSERYARSPQKISATSANAPETPINEPVALHRLWSRFLPLRNALKEKAASLLFFMFMASLFYGPILIHQKWDDIYNQYLPVRWWWESRSAVASVDTKISEGDFANAHQVLQEFLVHHPDNPHLHHKMADVLILLDQPYVAAVHLRYAAHIDRPNNPQRFVALAKANDIALTARNHALAIFREIEALYEKLPVSMQRADGVGFYPFEALFVPPVTTAANLAPFYKLENFGRTQFLCVLPDIDEKDVCRWPRGERVPLTQVLKEQRIRAHIVLGDNLPPCCQLALNDPDLVAPHLALDRIETLPPGHQLREMFRLASKLAFAASYFLGNFDRR